jgi:rod shape determining protein RodA
MRGQYQRKSEVIILSKLAHVPWLYVLCVIAISCIGFAALYSAAKGNLHPWAYAQMIKFLMGLFLMLVVAIIDIRVWFKASYLGYLFGVALLVAVMAMGVEGGLGAQRWLRIGGLTFQPSELMKVLLVLALARYFHSIHINDMKRLWVLIMPALLAGVAVILILKQPNLGTATITSLVTAGIFFMAGVGWKKFAVVGVIVLAMLPLMWTFVMRDYQKQRVETFLNPESDPLGAGYNIIQSKIAIGSGGFSGKGFLQGTQSQLSFVPERQTDFIFSIVAEEFGFLGSLTVIGLYMALVLMGMITAHRSESMYGKLLAYGISTVMFVHAFVNMGMVSGVLPVVGVPLPLISYGGSSMISTLVGLGFVLNSHVHRNIKV